MMNSFAKHGVRIGRVRVETLRTQDAGMRWPDQRETNRKGKCSGRTMRPARRLLGPLQGWVVAGAAVVKNLSRQRRDGDHTASGHPWTNSGADNSGCGTSTSSISINGVGLMCFFFSWFRCRRAPNSCGARTLGMPGCLGVKKDSPGNRKFGIDIACQLRLVVD